jgi:hypothetical protein
MSLANKRGRPLGFKLSEETKAAIRASKTGQTHSTKTINKISDSLKNIIKLYCPDGFELDPTYSVGNFYKKIKQPKYKFDINPVRSDVIKADSIDLPLRNESIGSIMFDPPFLATRGNVKDSRKKSNIIIKRFG